MLEAQLKAYLAAGETDEEFDLEAVPQAPSSPKRAPARGAAAGAMLPGAAGFAPSAGAGRGPAGPAGGGAAAASSARQAEAEALLKSIPSFASYGPLFKSCDPVR